MFPADDSLLKMLYLAMMDISKVVWTAAIIRTQIRIYMECGIDPVNYAIHFWIIFANQFHIVSTFIPHNTTENNRIQ